ncbi:MAG: tetratricopeptide repeat protein [Parvibaculales bacterium]
MTYIGKQILGSFVALAIFMGGWGVPVISVSTLTLLSNVETAHARKKRRPPVAKKVGTLGKRAYAIITDSREALAEGENAKARSLVNRILNNNKYTPYEKAIAHQVNSFIYADEGKFTLAIQSLQKMLRVQTIPKKMRASMNYNLAQLLLADDKPKKALLVMKRWLKATPKPPPAAKAMLANIYVIMGDFEKAEGYIREALQEAKQPRENWYRILLAVLVSDENWAEAADLLKTMVGKYPGKKIYWQQLSSVYGALEDLPNFFAAQQAMNEQEMLSKTKEFEILSKLYLYNIVPFEAAIILQREIKAGRVKENQENYELLANSWLMAREWEKASHPMRKAAELSEDGDLYLRLGQTYLRDEQWGKAEEAIALGVKKGKLKNEGLAWFLLGIARYKTDRLQEAREAFFEAANDDDYIKEALRWARNAERKMNIIKERERQAQLAAEEDAEKNSILQGKL